MTHIIPPGEDHLHALSKKCPCNPIMDTDDETGKMLCTHLPLTFNMEVLPEEDKAKERFEDNLFG